MNDTGPLPDADELALGYLGGRGDRPLPADDLPGMTADVGLASTLADMARWGAALLDGQTLAPEMVNRLFRGDAAAGCPAGYGWLPGEPAGVFIPGQGVAGYPAGMGVLPDDGLAWVVLGNQQAANAPALGEMLARIARAGSREAALAQLAAEVTGPPPNDQLAARIDDFLTQQTADGEFSGAILMARGDELILSQGYGLADQAQGIANTPQTRFYIASLTKAFTSMAIMQLAERGQLNVADPICDYLSDCPAAWEPITIHHLLTHTSGLGLEVDAASLSQLESPTLADAVRQLAEAPLDFEPGTAFSYSNGGYVILGHIVEQVAGQPYADFLQENIFEPLGMADSGFDAADPAGLATGYISDYEIANLDFVRFGLPAGAMISTVEDMQRWARALQSEELVSAATLEQIFTPHIVADPDSAEDYGYGWVLEEMYGRPAVWHGGGLNGFTSVIMLFPEDDLSLIILSNDSRVIPSAQGNIFAKWALGAE